MSQAMSPAPLTQPLDPRVCDRLASAQRQRYKIGVCAACGGPEVFAKTKPAAHCLRCDRHRLLDAIAPTPKRHRCLACWKIFYAVVNWQKCEKCRTTSG
jgi:hypothetical protein